MTPTPAQQLFIDKILQFIADTPELHPFTYSVGSGKTEALKMLERKLFDSTRKGVLIDNPYLKKGNIA